MKETQTAKQMAINDLTVILQKYSREPISEIVLTEEEAFINYEGGGQRTCRILGDSVVMTIFDVCKEIVR